MINRKLWKPPFSNLPSWPCPSCQSGTLTLKKEAFINLETGVSEKSHDHEAREPDWIDERFVGLLVCQNETCGEIVAIGGRSHIDEYVDFVDHDDYELQEQSWDRAYRPTFMYPAPPVFPIPEKCPEAVADELKKSFSLFWSDTGSCANRLRAAVEALLTDRKIPRTMINKKGKRERISLHARIEIFKQTDTRSAEYLSAIKWIGNAGSHANVDELSRDDLLSGFDLFEHVVELTYVKREKHLKKLARDINSRKGRPIRHKSAFLWE
jgi:Domain of unknown function (DUF4145)